MWPTHGGPFKGPEFGLEGLEPGGGKVTLHLRSHPLHSEGVPRSKFAHILSSSAAFLAMVWPSAPFNLQPPVAPTYSAAGPCALNCPNGDHFHITVTPITGNKVKIFGEVWDHGPPHSLLPRGNKTHTVPNGSGRPMDWQGATFSPEIALGESQVGAPPLVVRSRHRSEE